MVLKMFKAQRDTKMFQKNQKVWVSLDRGNHLHIKHKWRAKGRYVNSIIDKWNWTNQRVWNSLIGEQGLKDIEVTDQFYNFVTEKHTRHLKDKI